MEDPDRDVVFPGMDMSAILEENQGTRRCLLAPPAYLGPVVSQ